MVANPQRRAALADAAIWCLGSQGSRALTHRAVEQYAELPRGSAANYFPTRDSLMLGAAERIFERLRPDEGRLKAIERKRSSAAALTAYVQYVVERLLSDREVALALFELRLESARSAEVAGAIGPLLLAGFEADVQFHDAHGLPGGAAVVAALHYAVDGLVLDQLTIPLQPGKSAASLAAEVAAQVIAAS